MTYTHYLVVHWSRVYARMTFAIVVWLPVYTALRVVQAVVE